MSHDFLAATGYRPRLNLTWPHIKAIPAFRWFDHIRTFLLILGSVNLDKTTRGLGAWTEFDFRRLCFGPAIPYSVQAEPLMQNVRTIHYMYTSTEPYPSWVRS